MSLERTGVWQVGVWATTVWTDNVWYEIETPPTSRGLLGSGSTGNGIKSNQSTTSNITSTGRL